MKPLLKLFPPAFILATFLGCLVACEQKPKDDWYEISGDLDTRKQDFVEREMMLSGKTESEAKRDFGLIYAIEQTERIDPVTVKGEELNFMKDLENREAEKREREEMQLQSRKILP